MKEMDSITRHAVDTQMMTGALHCDRTLSRPETTLFLVMSVDGKISSGDSDEVDVDKDWNRIPGVADGMSQYYAIEQTTDLWSLNSGRTWAKTGANELSGKPEKTDLSFVVIDNRPHLETRAIEYYALRANQFVVVTTNDKHPAVGLERYFDNLHVLHYEKLWLSQALHDLRGRFGVQRLTIQTGGSLNAAFLRENLVDHVSLVVAPLLVGGKTTPTLVDGEAIHRPSELEWIRTMRLVSCDVLEQSFLHLRYDIRLS
jgi:2,5-diamino-6-(ribosylamino)-4(3H)-pyrimidinone 5'-phosphate reductase